MHRFHGSEGASQKKLVDLSAQFPNDVIQEEQESGRGREIEVIVQEILSTSL
jgi:hypothetical protein